MRRARPDGSAPCVAGPAESLPFDDRSFDAAMAILTIHHWTDYMAGLRELCRVARRCVLLVHWDQAVIEQFWLSDYFPEALAFDRRRGPALADVCATLDLHTDVVPLLVPHDCQDGFGGAYWRRPEAYLDPAVRAGISMLAQTEQERGNGLERLQQDLSNGAWDARYGGLLRQTELDCGYRLVVGRK
jgi:SAM-dependent methyltransferase